jgi:hypothetical protein
VIRINKPEIKEQKVTAKERKKSLSIKNTLIKKKLMI